MAQFTLADAKNLSQDKLTNYVIDEFRKSPLLDAMVFDDCVKPQGGSSMTYVYNRVTPSPPLRVVPSTVSSPPRRPRPPLCPSA